MQLLHPSASRTSRSFLDFKSAPMDSFISFAGGKLDQCESFVEGVLLSQAHDASRWLSISIASAIPCAHVGEL